MNDLPDEIERLEKRLEALERRVHALEHPAAARSPHPSPELEAAPPPHAVAAAPLAPAGSMFPVLGRAMLGIAGAYVLRAVEAASSLPRLAVASAGIGYAFLWLVWAARTRGGPRFASAIYAGTSALILAPMLWELTLRFKILPAAISAAVLCAYVLAAMGLGALAGEAIRVSLPWNATVADVAAFADAYPRMVARLREALASRAA